MPRFRTCVAEFAAKSRLSFAAAYFYDQLQAWMDDRGRIELLPKKIAGNLYPHREDVDARQIRAWVSECEAEGILLSYSFEGSEYVWNPLFLAQQRINRPSPSRLPPHPDDPSIYLHVLPGMEDEEQEESPKAHGGLTEDSLNNHGGLTDDSPKAHDRINEGSLAYTRSLELGDSNLENPPKAPLGGGDLGSKEPGKRRIRKRDGDATEPPWFESWWNEFNRLYPKRGGGFEARPNGRRKLLAIASKGEGAMVPILEGVRRFRIYADLTGASNTDTGVCQMTTWVNQERWLESYQVPAIPKPPGDAKTSVPDKRGPIQGVHFEERAKRDPDGSVRRVLVWNSSGLPIDRPSVFEWFDLSDCKPDWREGAERWCEAHGLRPDDAFKDEVAA